MDLPRAFRCDFEEYRGDGMEQAEIHIYVGLTEDGKDKVKSCELLKQFAYDEKQGDNGKRLEQCRCWRSK